MIKIGIRAFLKAAEKYAVIDVRSPKEYEADHIPGAINIPVLNNEERAEIGTIYKQKGKIPAIQKGLELVGPKAMKMAKTALGLAKKNQLLVYCWRGGMRSQKMTELFETVGIQCQLLDGGYKSYRNQAMEEFGDLEKLYVLRGPTGSGKTAILLELKKLGEQILDLEGVANHRGSAFGSLGQEKQPPTKQFQNLLYEKLRQLDPQKRIWIESESLTIGRVYLPEPLWKAMNKALVIEVVMDKKWRIKRLLDEYGEFSKEELTQCITAIERKFGAQRVKNVLALLEEDKGEEVAKMLLDYYDVMYAHSNKKYKERKPIFVHCNDGDARKNAVLLLEEVQE